VGSRRFVDENVAPNITSPHKGNHPMKRGERESLPLEAWMAFRAGTKNKKSNFFFRGFVFSDFGSIILL
jgi:hypothetical protein